MSASVARGRARRADEDAPSRAAERTSGDAGAQDADAPPVALQRGLALGFLSMLPLFAAYEIAVLLTGARVRNAAEVILTLPSSVLGVSGTTARLVALAIASVVAGWIVFHERLGLAPRVARVVGEGALCALVLGPLLFALQRAFDLGVPSGLEGPHAPSAAPLGPGLVVVAGAAFEEIVFRVGLQSAVFVLAFETVAWFTPDRPVARVVAEVSAVGASALVFAALHLAAFLRPLGAGGEPWDATVFAWRALAGVALAVLFRWRGPGVAAWTHAFFNLALYVGAGPDVFL